MHIQPVQMNADGSNGMDQHIYAHIDANHGPNPHFGNQDQVTEWAPMLQPIPMTSGI